MGPELLAATAALTWGSSGLAAGVLSRGRPALLVALAAQTGGAVLLLAIALAAGGVPSGRTVLVGAVGGVIGCIGLVWLYEAFSGPSVGLAAPIASSGILVPVGVGVLSGAALGPTRLAGAVVLVCGLAAVLAARDGGEADRRTLRLAVGAALSFGLFYLALDAGAADDAVWVTTCARLGAVAALALHAARTRALTAQPAGRWVPLALAVGLVDAAGNLAYAAATATGSLTVVSLISAAYPAVSVVLAAVLLREHVPAVRMGGVLATVLGLGLVAA
jgi:drug/metabolite transporter (DMT)-like permease